MSAPDDVDPREELRSLADSLARVVGRRARFGQRRLRTGLDAPAAPVAAAAEIAETEPTIPAAAPPAVAPERPPPAPARTRDIFISGSSARTSLSPIAELARSAPDLQTLRERVAACTACSLCETRTQTVFSDGSGQSGVLFVGEAPGEQEDLRGVPFVGRAGQLLTDIIEKGMGLSRADVTICNVLKCRPPNNRDPSTQEKETCTPWLDRQIELANPRLLIALGRHAAGHLLSTESSLSRLRGRLHERAGRKVLVTFHPAYLLRNPADKKECWKDIQLAMRELGLAVPGRDAGKPQP